MDSHLFCDTDCFSLQEMIERDMRSPFDPVLGVVQDLDLDPADCDDDYCHFPPNRSSLPCVVNDQDSIDSFDNLQLRAGTSHFTWFPGSAAGTVSVSDVENSVCATTVIVNPHAAMPQLQPQSSTLLTRKSTSPSSSSSSSSDAPCVEDNLVTVANRNALAEALASVARHHRQHKRQKVQHRRRHSDVTEDDSDSSPPPTPTPRIKAPSSAARVKREPKAKARKLEGGGVTYGGGVESGVPGDSDDVKAYPKPTYSYSCLIAMALKNSSTGCLPVSEIYSFMTENFPYFKTAPHGWKNSVRHNLSLNKCFEKIEKPPASSGTNKKGCLWTMNPDKVGKMEEEMQKWSRKDPIAIKLSMACPENLDTLEKGFRHCVPIKARKKAVRAAPKVETITLKHEEIDVTIPAVSFKSGLWNDLEDESLGCLKADSDPEDLHITVSKNMVGGNSQRNLYGRVLTHGSNGNPSLLPLLN